MSDMTNEATTGFGELGLRPELLAVLSTLGYEEPTPIQREAIPLMIAGHDLLGQAATGTGKTAAFALPILQRIDKGAAPVPTALVLVPTRELAVQVSEAMYKYGRDLGARVVPIYGGQPIGRQLQQLDRGVHIVVATPGRAIDHLRRGSLPLDAIQLVVLDEADEMLDMGFAEDIEAILDATPATRQTVLFSATMPPRINAIARKHQRDPIKVQIQSAQAAAGSAPLVRQSAYVVMRQHKAAALGRILDVESPAAAIVFCRTRNEVDELSETLNGRGYRAEPLHGGMSQEQRDRVMSRMRNGTAELLIATDVAARGLDLDQLTHVFNYDVPAAPESYVHRIGRVGRAGREGIAITLAEPREQRLLANIERLTRHPIPLERIPTVADLRARQLEHTLGTLRDAVGGDDLSDYNHTLTTLLSDYEMRDIALAAIKVAHAATATQTDKTEIPEPGVKRDYKDRGPSSYNDRPPRTYNDRPERSYNDRPESKAKRTFAGDADRPAKRTFGTDARPPREAGAPAWTARPRKSWEERDGGPATKPRAAGTTWGSSEREVPSFDAKPKGKVWGAAKPMDGDAKPSSRFGSESRFGTDRDSFSRPERPSRGPSNGDGAKLYINMGKTDGIRPQDLVGAIANETNLSGRDIGPITIAERYSIVGVPDHAADAVIEAIKNTTLKGKRAKARRYAE